MERDLAVIMLPRTRKLCSTRRTMSNGRSERRIARIVSVEVCVEAERKLNGRMLTENVSAHGARVFMERKFEPGQQALVSARPPLGRFAVGLELSGPVE